VNLLKINQAWVALFVAAVLVFTASSYSAAGEEANKTSTQSQQILIAASSDDDDVNDPLESINRAIFNFNEFILDLLLRPISEVYKDNLPAVFRTGVKNFITNLSTPVTIANHFLQGDPDEALRSVGRMMANTIVGIGGMVDVAGELGAPGRDEDFGQTLGVWGVDEGIYLVLPIFGPSNPRDLVGKFIVDPYFDATGYWISDTDKDAIDWSLKATGGVSEYAGVVDELDQIKKTSVDYYAAVRSLYRQKRKSEISNGEQLDLPPIPDLGYDLAPTHMGNSSVAVTN